MAISCRSMSNSVTDLMLSNENSRIFLCLVCVCVCVFVVFCVGQHSAFDKGAPDKINNLDDEHIVQTYCEYKINGNKIYYQLEWTINSQKNPFTKTNVNLN